MCPHLFAVGKKNDLEYFLVSFLSLPKVMYSLVSEFMLTRLYKVTSPSFFFSRGIPSRKEVNGLQGCCSYRIFPGFDKLQAP